jgi:hypothetical protein
MWILTTEYNDYDQHGEYFVAYWQEKPTKEQLLKAGVEWSWEDRTVNHVLSGGGEINTEYQSWNLFKAEPGKSYHDC